MPVSSVVLYTAIGKKATHIKRQILCKVVIGEIVCESVFLIVPNLSNAVILGNDWLLKNKSIVNYDKSDLTVQGILVQESLVSFGRFAMDNGIVMEGKDDIKYLQSLNIIDNSKICDVNENSKNEVDDFNLINFWNGYNFDNNFVDNDFEVDNNSRSDSGDTADSRCLPDIEGNSCMTHDNH